MAAVYPIVFGLDFWYVFFLTLILSMNLFVQYMFSITLRTLLNADKKVYIVSITQIIITTLNIALVYISVKIYPSIHFLQPLVYGCFVKKYYEIDWKAKSDTELLKERWNGFAVNLAAFVHNCTDIALLTIFTDLVTVSIYNVYSLVTVGLKSLVQALTSGISSTIGQAYAREDWKELNQKLDLFEYIIFFVVAFMFTVSALLITPFVLIYTSGIKDANYNQPILGVLLVISEALYIIKLPHLQLSYDANKFKEITKPAFSEAIINIVVSLILIRRYSFNGIIIGTIVAMAYRMAFQVYYTSKIVENRVQSIFYKKFILFSIVSVVGAIICYKLFPIKVLTITNWIIHAIEYSIFLGILYLMISIIFFKNELNYFVRYIKRK